MKEVTNAIPNQEVSAIRSFPNGCEAACRAWPSKPSEISISRQKPSSSGLPWLIEMVPLSQLKRAARNPRVHPENQIKQIVSSIRHFGYIDPVLADEKRNIIGGHARANAAERAGLRKIPVIVISGLSDAEKRALALADNAIATNAVWNPKLLAEELGELSKLLPEINLDLDQRVRGRGDR